MSLRDALFLTKKHYRNSLLRNHSCNIWRERNADVFLPFTESNDGIAEATEKDVRNCIRRWKRDNTHT